MNYGTTPLRIEFLLPGAAALGAVLWFLAALGQVMHIDPVGGLIAALSPAEIGSVQGVTTILLIIATAYAIGVAVVMGTFYWPTSRMIENIRARRLVQIRSMNEWAPTPVSAKAAKLLHDIFNPDQCANVAMKSRQHWWTCQDRWWVQCFSKSAVESQGLLFALSIARANISAPAQSEIEYRRATRQVCAGTTPSVVLGTLAAEFMCFSTQQPAVVKLALGTLVLLVGTIAVGGLMATASYQERVAQLLLVDVAFVYYLDRVGPASSAKDTSSDMIPAIGGDLHSPGDSLPRG